MRVCRGPRRTRTWKESTDPDYDAKLDRIEYVTSQLPGPVLRVRPVRAAVDPAVPRRRLGAAPPSRTGCRRPTTAPTASATSTAATASGDDQLWGVVRRRKGGDHTLAALKSDPRRPTDGAPIYVILDNLSANKTPAIREWAAAHKVELCLTPTYGSWANPIEAQFGPLRTFTMANSNYPNHPVLARDLQAYLRWRNAHARHPDVLAAQRRERARIRSENATAGAAPSPRRRRPDPVNVHGHRTSDAQCP